MTMHVDVVGGGTVPAVENNLYPPAAQLWNKGAMPP